MLGNVSDDIRLLRNAWSINKARAVDIVVSKVNDRLRPSKVSNIYDCEGEPLGHVLMSYMVEPFHDGFELPYIQPTSRQSTWQAREIAQAFNDLGYAVDVFRLDEPIQPSDFGKYDILFGLEPNFERFAEGLGRETLKIYYATGMHWSQRNPSIQRHLEALRERRGVELAALRTLPETEAEALADALIVIGDDFTADTYREHVGEKPTYNLYTTTYDFLECGVEETDFETARTNFLWFSGGDLANKGLDVTLEVVAEMGEIDLFVCGPLETDVDFVDIYFEELFETENIHPIGWTDVASTQFQKLTAKCGFVIHTGCSEGFPGSIAHCMRRGLIPVVTPEVIYDTEDWGMSIPDRELNSIRQTIRSASQTEPEDLREMAYRNCRKAEREHSRNTFSRRIREILTTILDGHGVQHRSVTVPEHSR